MTERMHFQEIRSGVFVAQGNYAIRRDTNETPAYWIAYQPDSNGRLSLAPPFEIAGGAGDEGWSKCVRFCELHRTDPYATRAVVDSSKMITAAKVSEPIADKLEPRQRGLEL